MSNIIVTIKKCSLCSEENIIRKPKDLKYIGSRAVDGCPAATDLGNLWQVVESCHICRYTADDLGREMPPDIILASHEVLDEILDEKDWPRLVKLLFYAGLVCRERGDLLEAGFMYLRASWVADNWFCEKTGSKFREIAFDYLVYCYRNGIAIRNEHGPADFILVDLLRRKGLFKKAINLADDLLAQPGLDERSAKILQHEKGLCEWLNSGILLEHEVMAGATGRMPSADKKENTSGE